MSGFFDALRDFVNNEAETQLREVRETWALPVDTRVANGDAIAGVEVVGTQEGLVWLRCPENVSKFRPPEPLRLHRGDPEAPEGMLRCTLLEDQGTELLIGPAWGTTLDGMRPGGGWHLDRDLVDTRANLLAALDTLQMLGPGARLNRLLRGELPPLSDPAREAQARALADGLGLNAAQHDAFVRAFSIKDYALVQGPPGTGKTWVLAHLAAALANAGERVLVTAYTHRAINNALRKIASVTGYPHVFKIGEQAHADDLDGVPNYEDFHHSPYLPEQVGLIAGATCYAARSRRLRDVRFHTIIFDEAGQITLPVAIAGMLSGKRFIFIGDHRQMGPVVAARPAEAWTAQSVFEMLFERAPGTLLNVTYRMNAEINAFPSQRFYGGMLQPSDEARGARLRLARPPERYAEALDPAYPNVFVKVPHQGCQMRAPDEAEIAAELVAEAIACGVPAAEIAVVTPYRAQARLIRTHLAAQPFPTRDVVVDTVERIQGQERDLVILSLTTSDTEHAARGAQFFFQPNRLNVAITRPRVKRIVLGSPVLFTCAPREPQLRAWVEHFSALYNAERVVRLDPA
jgi:DNA replication ATP-dependent helicase Dna2